MREVAAGGRNVPEAALRTLSLEAYIIEVLRKRQALFKLKAGAVKKARVGSRN